MKQKKILLLGGSAQQLVAIRAAKEMGYYTVLCDYLPDNPGQFEADKYYNASTTDVDAVCRIAKDEAVGGILAYASDPAALPAAIVAERLGLPTNPVAAVEVLGVKHKFRDFLQANAFACPRHVAFPPSMPLGELKDRLKQFRFPIVVKPTDSSGSKGVTKLADTAMLAEAVACAEGFSRNKILIAEEFIHRGFPDVIGGDIFVCNGDIVLCGEMSCLRDDGGKGLIPIGKKWPSGLSVSQRQAVRAELQRMVDLLGVRFGEMNIEIILDEQDRPHFIELGPRAGGNMIPIQLGDAYGVDLVKANVLAAMGERPELEPKGRQGCYMHYVLHSHEAGRFAGVTVAKEIERSVYRKVIYKQPGDEVQAFDGAGKALGILFLHFENEVLLDDFCKRRDQLVKVNLLD